MTQKEGKGEEGRNYTNTVDYIKIVSKTVIFQEMHA
jgi:hypothetical protein